MKRGLLAIAAGVAFLILMTGLGTIITNIVPQRTTAQVQTAQAGPYSVTLQVNPNPPPVTHPTSLSIQVLLSATHRPVSNARVTLASDMETMDMGTDRADARPSGNGMYLARVQFSMSGPWAIQVAISAPGEPGAIAMFEVSAQ
ncbi:MAG TPA: FixH family protein [Ktedonobacteraceae bacterium]|nr:FixH family protein [Ktedonobacteraceae bacterium]